MNYFKVGSAAFLIAAALCGSSAMAQVNDDAKSLLTESGAAIKAIKGVSYKSKLYGLGALSKIMDGEGDVKQIRSTTDPKFSPVWVKGNIAEIGKGKTPVYVSTNGKTIRWQDDPSNTVFERSIVDRNDAARILGLGNQVVLGEFKEGAPMAKELTAHKLEITGDADVHGEKCKVVVASWDGGVRSTTYWISVNDKLPRKVELAHGANNQDPEKRLAKGTEIWDLHLLPELKDTDLFITVPKGFAEDKQEAPAPKNVQQDFNAQQNPGVPAAPPPDPILGPAVGTDAPEFDLKDTGGQAVKLSSNKGSVVVLTFAGSRFPKSVATGDILQTLSGSYKDKGVKFYAASCREESDDAAKGLVAKQKWTFPTLLNGDSIVNSYRIVGFPSTCIIGADGKVTKFFQGPVTKDQLETEIQAALKGAGK